MGKRKNNVVGEYPLSLYRFFSKEKYAQMFIQDGKFRAGFIQEYKKNEYGERSDSTEGEGHYGLPGEITKVHFSKNPKNVPFLEKMDGIQHHHTSYGNSIFLFCCSNVDVNIKAMKKYFGEFVVKICSPVSLAIDIDYALNGHKGERNYLIDGRNVEYNKGEVLKDERSSIQLSEFAYIQKPKTYEIEKEFRFCLMGLGPDRLTIENNKRFIDIDIGEELQYLRML